MPSDAQATLTPSITQISDEWVVRILINGSRIERTLLANTRLEAEAILREHPKYTAWTEDCVRVQRYSCVILAIPKL
jgi:hypothetical protein